MHLCIIIFPSHYTWPQIHDYLDKRFSWTQQQWCEGNRQSQLIYHIYTP